MFTKRCRFLVTPAAAEYTGSTSATLIKYRWLGKGPRFIKLGRKVLYDIDELDRWIEASRRTSTSQAQATT